MTSVSTRAVLIAAALTAIAQPVRAQGTRPALTTRPDVTPYGCLVCHADKRRAFVQGVHSDWGIRCHDCHGGDPVALEVGPAHAGEFVGVPDKLQTVEICSSFLSNASNTQSVIINPPVLLPLNTTKDKIIYVSRCPS